tara:strand:+ start:60 stop:563 length:504 start_codon:yes stop_codon:yes gene_type:complete
MLSNEKIHHLSLIFSLVIHIVFFIGFSTHYKSSEPVSPVTQPVPIDYIVKEIVIEKPVISKQVIKKPKKKKIKNFPNDRKKAVIKSKKMPFYPKEAINFGYEGTVVVDVYLNSKGRIASIKTIKSSGHKILDQTFIATIKSSYIFKPKRVKGMNKKDKIRLSYTFEL